MATRNDYFGYIPSETRIDWGKMTGDLAKTITDAYGNREKVREELDQIKTTNDTLVTNTERGKTQALNELVLSGADDAKMKMLEWNKALKRGEITAKEYKNRMNNLTENWKAFANNMKTFDTRMQDIMSRQQPGEDGKIAGSGFEASVNQKIASLGDLRNKKITIDNESGKVYMGSLDPATGQYNPNTLIDAMSIGNVSNMLDNRVDVVDLTSDLAKTFKDWSVSNPGKTVQDARQNPFLSKAKNNFKAGVLSNNRMVTSILVDNGDGDYDIYFDDDDRKNKLQQMLSAEMESRKTTPKYSSSDITKKIEQYKKNNKKATTSQLEQYRDKLESETVGDMTLEEQRKFIEDAQLKLIPAVLDENGVYQPQPTQYQLQQADAILDASIESQLPKSVQITPVTRSSGGGGGGGGSKGSGGAPNTALYRQIVSGFNDRSPAGAARLAAASGGKYRFEFKPGEPGVFVSETRYVSDGNGGQVAQDFEIGYFQNARDLAPIVGFASGTGATSSTAFDEWDASERAVMGGKSTNNKSGKAEGDDLFKNPK